MRSSGNAAVTSAPITTSGWCAISSAPEIVLWSVSATRSMPRAFAVAYATSGSVYDSGMYARFRNQLPVSVDARECR